LKRERHTFCKDKKGADMIKPKKLAEVGIVVRDLAKSLAWYREHFGFEKLFDVSNGVVIGSDSVHLWLAEVADLDQAKVPDSAKDLCIRLISFEVSETDLSRVGEEFPEDDDIDWIDHPKYRSCVIDDPDGHAIELYVWKTAEQAH